MIKIVFCLRRREGLSREDFQRYWLEHHGPLVRAHGAALGIRRYTQAHSLPDRLSLSVAGPRNSPEPFDGVAELWFDDLESVGVAARTPEGRAAAELLLDDEREFIDLERSPFFLVEEHELIGDEPPG
jgi:uncharacterized protein (TIGR02118 family)